MLNRYMFTSYRYAFLCELLVQALLLCFGLFIVDFRECLYILDVSPLSVTCIEEIISHSVPGIFTYFFKKLRYVTYNTV